MTWERPVRECSLVNDFRCRAQRPMLPSTGAAISHDLALRHDWRGAGLSVPSHQSRHDPGYHAASR